MRRLPVYIIIDTSSSMRGEPIEAVKRGLNELKESLSQDPYALETVYLSIITYDTHVRQLVPLTEVYRISIPELVAKGRSALGGAINLLTEKIDTEVIRNTSERKGDWRPLVFLLSDGGYEGPFMGPIKEFKKRKCGIVVACAAGLKAHIDNLQKITDNIVQISSTDSANIYAFFKWVSSSIGTSSMKIETTGADVASINELPPPPAEIMIFKSQN